MRARAVARQAKMDTSDESLAQLAAAMQLPGLSSSESASTCWLLVPLPCCRLVLKAFKDAEVSALLLCCSLRPDPASAGQDFSIAAASQAGCSSSRAEDSADCRFEWSGLDTGMPCGSAAESSAGLARSGSTSFLTLLPAARGEPSTDAPRMSLRLPAESGVSCTGAQGCRNVCTTLSHARECLVCERYLLHYYVLTGVAKGWMWSGKGSSRVRPGKAKTYQEMPAVHCPACSPGNDMGAVSAVRGQHLCRADAAFLRSSVRGHVVHLHRTCPCSVLQIFPVRSPLLESCD